VGAVQCPLTREIASVLAAVTVPEHYLLDSAARRHLVGIGAVRQHSVQDAGGVIEAVHAFKQGHDVDVAFREAPKRPVHQAGDTAEPQGCEYHCRVRVFRRTDSSRSKSSCPFSATSTLPSSLPSRSTWPRSRRLLFSVGGRTDGVILDTALLNQARVTGTGPARKGPRNHLSAAHPYQLVDNQGLIRPNLHGTPTGTVDVLAAARQAPNGTVVEVG